MTGVVNPWAWHAHPDVWAVLLGVVIAYRFGIRRYPATRRQVTWFAFGMVALAFGAGWPVHDIAERYLLSVHMLQHLLFTLVAPPLLLLGLPAPLIHRLLRPRFVGWAFTRLARPLLAALAFNTVIVISHWPDLVDFALRVEVAHFAVHLVLFATAVLMWFPVISRLPEYPSLGDPARMLYLFLQSVVPTVPASFLTFGDSPMYDTYANAPRPFDISAVGDQQMAGAVMKVIGGFLLWGIIVTIFFRWYSRTERDAHGDVLTWDDVERELKQTPAPG
jgi:putative membrane protein